MARRNPTNLFLFTNQMVIFAFKSEGQNNIEPPPSGPDKLFWWGHGPHWDNHFPVVGLSTTEEPWSKRTQ